MKKLPFYIFLVGLFFSPFIYWPLHEVPFEIPKVFFINRWIEVLAVSGIIFSLRSSKKAKYDNKLIAAVILFFFFTIISSFLGSDLAKSVVGNYYRQDGLVTLFHLISFYFFVVLFIEQDWIRPMLSALWMSSVIIAGWSVVDYLRMHLISEVGILPWEGATGISFGNPNFLAGYLLVTLPFTYFALSKAKGLIKYIILTGITIQIAAIVVTYSWSGMLGIFIFFALIIISKRSKVNFLLLIATLTGLLLISALIYKNQSNLNSSNILVAESRERIFTKAFLAFKERPLLGWGWANFDHAFDAVVWPIKLESDVYVDKAHSNFIEILVTTGVIGFVVYVFIILRTLLNLTKAKKGMLKYFFIPLVLFIFHSQTNIISISEELLFWLFAGIASRKRLLS